MNPIDMFRRFFIYCWTILLFYSCQRDKLAPSPELASPPPTTISNPLPSRLLKKAIASFEDSLQHAMQLQGFPGAAFAVVEGGKIVHSQGYGLRQIGCKEPVDRNTVFRIASLSKAFPAVLTGMLVQDSTLRWDDAVKDYLPDLTLSRASAADSLSIRHLLSHTTGLPRHTYSNLLNMGVPYADILSQLKDVRVAHTPGTWYNYQNVVYSLIGDVVQKAVGKSYDQLLEERVFKPLDMQHASTGFYALQAGDNVAAPHKYDGEKYFPSKASTNFYSVLPAAGVNASVQDMAKWMLLMLGHREKLLDSLTLWEIQKEQIAVSPRERVMRSWRPVDASGYGLGWRTAIKNGTRIVFHGGFVNGYRAEILLLPEEDIGLVVLTNSFNPFIGHCLPYFLELIQRDVVR